MRVFSLPELQRRRFLWPQISLQYINATSLDLCIPNNKSCKTRQILGGREHIKTFTLLTVKLDEASEQFAAVL